MSRENQKLKIQSFHAEKDPADLYLDLMKRVLSRAILPEQYRNVDSVCGPRKQRVLPLLQGLLSRYDLVAVGRPLTEADNANGPDLATQGETMLGLPRLDNLHHCIADAFRHNVPGDLFEAGVWRGGATIFMRAALEAYGEKNRVVWVADSFQGVPPPDTDKYPADAGSPFWTMDVLSVSREQVERNFARYGFLDDQVRFLQGWFRDTLPDAPLERLAVLRVDGDSYESTTDALSHLYPKLSVGGYAIVDDYGAVEACRQAVDDYRGRHHITEPMHTVEDWQNSCVSWRRER